jgi:nucleoside-diphosphate kinase
MRSLGPLLTELQTTFTFNKLKMVDLDSRSAEKFSCIPGLAIAFESTVHGDVEVAAAKFTAYVKARGCYGSTTLTSAADDAACFGASPAVLPGATTACIIKPHIVQEGSIGEIILAITTNGFTIGNIEMISLDSRAAGSFFECYKGVFPHYSELMAHVTEGPCVFLLIRGGSDVVDVFREFCGPPDVEIARVLRPRSLRAIFGKNKVKNAVHCTDLATDGALESQFLMQLLS